MVGPPYANFDDDQLMGSGVARDSLSQCLRFSVDLLRHASLQHSSTTNVRLSNSNKTNRACYNH